MKHLRKIYKSYLTSNIAGGTLDQNLKWILIESYPVSLP